jgi:hypothetical protein
VLTHPVELLQESAVQTLLSLQVPFATLRQRVFVGDPADQVVLQNELTQSPSDGQTTGTTALQSVFA